MGILKRKRSESELSFSSGSNFSSPPRAGSSSDFKFGGMDTGAHSPIRRYGTTASHMPSRTLKRFRDNRLPEEEIHQNTLKMLYTAQQQHLDRPQPTQVHTSYAALTPQPEITASRSSGQRSLHAFFNISSPAARPDMLPPPIEKAALALASDRTSCEDCGTRILDVADDAMMDIDRYNSGGAGATQCVVCGKVVCDSCSVSNLGTEPRCLVCAGRDVRWNQGPGISAW